MEEFEGNVGNGSTDAKFGDTQRSTDVVIAELVKLLQPHTSFSVKSDNLVEATKQLLDKQSKMVDSKVSEKESVHLHIRPDDECWGDVVLAAAKKIKKNSTDNTETRDNSTEVLNDAAALEKAAFEPKKGNTPPAHSIHASKPSQRPPPSTAGSRILSRGWRESWKIGARVELQMAQSPYAKLAGTVTRTAFAVGQDTYDIQLDNGDQVLDVLSPWLSTLL